MRRREGRGRRNVGESQRIEWREEREKKQEERREAGEEKEDKREERREEKREERREIESQGNIMTCSHLIFRTMPDPLIGLSVGTSTHRDRDCQFSSGDTFIGTHIVQ